MELAVTIRVLRSTWVAKHTFDLDPVSVERIDILESKLRDQEMKLKKLWDDVKAGDAPPFINLTTVEKHGQSILRWGAVQTDEFVSTGLDGKVKVCRGGVYDIRAIASVANGDAKLQLLKNGKVIQMLYPGFSGGYWCSGMLSTVYRLEKNDEITITTLLKLAGA